MHGRSGEALIIWMDRSGAVPGKLLNSIGGEQMVRTWKREFEVFVRVVLTFEIKEGKLFGDFLMIFPELCIMRQQLASVP